MVWLEWRRGSDQYTLTRLSWDIWRPLWICIFWLFFGHCCSTADRIDLKFRHSVAVDQALEMARSPVLYGQSKARARGVCVPYYSAARPILFKRYVKKWWIDESDGTVRTRICSHFQKCKNHPDQSRFDQVMKDFWVFFRSPDLSFQSMNVKTDESWVKSPDVLIKRRLWWLWWL